jgi:hypothetical protein
MPPGRSLMPSRSSSSRTLLTPLLLQPEDSWVLGPFLCVSVFWPRGLCK